MDLVKRQDVALTTVDGTVYSIVFQTAEPTFTGVIGGFSTQDPFGSQPTPPSGPDPGSAPSDTPSAPSPTEAAPQTTAAPTASRSLGPPASFSNPSNTIAASPTANNGGVLGTSSSGTSSSDTTSSSSSSGMSTGAKAGLAIGIIAVVGLLAVFLLWLLGKKRKQIEAQSNSDNEKFGRNLGPNTTEMASRSPPVSASAPRLSLRPMSRMLPEFGGRSKSRLSGNLLGAIGESDNARMRQTPSPQPRGPSPGPAKGLGLSAPRANDNHPNNPFADPQNPFADPEKTLVQAPAPLHIDPSPAKKAMMAPAAAALMSGAVMAPQPEPMRPAAAIAAPTPARVPVPAAAPIAVASTAPVQVQEPIAMPEPVLVQAPKPAPAPTASPVPSAPASPLPIAAAGTAPEPQGNVFRVMMDFVPSMDDELGLKTGQLVRMLHEYDDGWVSHAHRST
jgi:hypothetical protein